MSKVPFNRIISEFKSAGYELLSTESEYINVKHKLKYKCPKHGVREITYSSFNQGGRCKLCSLDKRRLSYSKVKEKIEAAGYKLLDDSYKNNSTKLLCLCPKHGEFRITYNDLQSGYGCNRCGIERTCTPYDKVKTKVESLGYELLDKTYTNNSTKLLCLCPKHGEFKTTYRIIAGGSICKKCAIDKRKVPYNIVKKNIESHGYKLLDKTYVNSNTKLLCSCPVHGNFKIRYGDIQSGYGCKKCAIDKMKGKLSPVWNGGTTALRGYLREKINPWVQQQLQRTNYTCEITGKQGTLNVHHMVSFNKIFKMTMKELHMDIRENIGDYSEDELQLITVNLMKNNDLYANPIVMLQSVHQEFHQFCGGNHKETTMEKLKEFTEYYRQHNSLEEL